MYVLYVIYYALTNDLHVGNGGTEVENKKAFFIISSCPGDRKGKFMYDKKGFFSRNYAIVTAPEVKIEAIKPTTDAIIL